MHQSPAGHLQECLHCCEWFTVQLDPRALNHPGQKQEVKRIKKKLLVSTCRFFSPPFLSIFLAHLTYGKNHQHRHGKQDAKTSRFPAVSIGIISFVPFWSFPAAHSPSLRNIHTGLFTLLHNMLTMGRQA